MMQRVSLRLAQAAHGERLWAPHTAALPCALEGDVLDDARRPPGNVTASQLRFAETAMRHVQRFERFTVTHPASYVSLPTALREGKPKLAMREVWRLPRNLSAAPEGWRSSPRLVSQLIERNAEYFAYASDTVRADRDVAVRAIEKSPSMLEHASPELRADPAVVRLALQRTTAPMVWVEDSLLGDYDFMLERIQVDRQAYGYASAELRANPVLQKLAGYRADHYVNMAIHNRFLASL